MTGERLNNQRVLDAFNSSPIKGVLWQSGGWVPIFQHGMEKSGEACKRHEICDHGFDHIFRVCENALVLKDMFTSSFPKEQFSDSLVLLPVMVHDLGYGDSGLVWDGKWAHDHPQSSKRIFKAITQLVDQPNNPSLQILKNYEKLFSDAISINLETALDRARNLADKSEVTWQEVFPIIVKLADAFDRYHYKRVLGIQPPSHHKINPYYALCQAVEGYRLSQDPNTGSLNFSVSLDKTSVPGGPNGTDWIKQVYQENKHWELAQFFSELSHMSFQTHTQQSDIRKNSTGSYVRNSSGEFVESYRLFYDKQTSKLNFIVCVKHKTASDENPIFPGGPVESSNLFNDICQNDSTVWNLTGLFAKLTKSTFYMSEGCGK